VVIKITKVIFKENFNIQFSFPKVCQCQRHQDCPNDGKCDGCNCIMRKNLSLNCKKILYKRYIWIQTAKIPDRSACDHCPPGMKCDPTTGACYTGELKSHDSFL
jgi:hypothetical protein